MVFGHCSFLFLPEKKNSNAQQQVEGRRSGNANKSMLGGGSTSISGGGGLAPTLFLDLLI